MRHVLRPSVPRRILAVAGAGCLCAALWLALLPGPHVAAAPAAADGPWSKETILFEDTTAIGRVSDPRIIADSTGRVHVFWNYMPDRAKPAVNYVMYATFDGTSWSKANDILPGAQPGRPLVVLDQKGLFHIAWGNYHYQAPVGNAGVAGAWSRRENMGFAGTANALQIDGQGNLHVAYTKQANTMVIGYVHGTGDGKRWSPESTLPGVIDLEDPKEAQSSPEMAVDAHGGVHIVWTDYELPGGWPPAGVFYARSKDEGVTWEGPFRLMGGLYGQPGILIDSKNVIHIVWRGTSAQNGTFYIYSRDEGATWNGPDLIQPDGGFSGDQTLREDSAGNIHLITADASEMVWDGKAWKLDETNRDKCEQSDLAVSRGNQIYLACAALNPQDVHYRILIFTRQTSGPQLAAQAAPTPMPTPTRVLPTATPTATPFVVAGKFKDQAANAPSISSTAVILYSIAPVLALILSVILWRSRQSR